MFDMMQLVGLIYDGHTRLLPTGMFEQDFAQIYPIELAWLDDGIFVARTTADVQKALGAQLVAINEQPVDEIVERLEPVLFCDYSNSYGLQMKAELALTLPGLLYAADVVPDRQQATFTVITSDGATLDLLLRAREDSTNK